MQDAAELGRLPLGAHLLRVAALDVDAQLLLQDVNLLVERQLTATEEPRTAKGGATHHNGIDTIVLKVAVGIVQRLDVTITDNGNVDARITLHLADESPVSLAGVHLAACATVDGQRLDATVLQLLGQRGDGELFVVPPQAGLHGDGKMHRLDHAACNI